MLLHRKSIIASACLLLLSILGGCARLEPDKTVVVEITGVSRGLESDEVLAMLNDLYDKNAKYKVTRSRFDDTKLTVTMSPVTDVDAFVRRIDFGDVTQVTGRTVKVRYGKRGSILRA